MTNTGWSLLLQVIGFAIYSTYLSVEATSTQGNSDLIFCDKDVTWTEAFQSCLNISATLVSKLSTADKQIIDTKPKKKIWVGQYVQSTPWMYTTGCYRMKRDADYKLLAHSVVQCSRACNGSDIYLNPSNCFCTQDQPNKSEMIDFKNCNSKCRGNEQELCGGENAFSHYANYKQKVEETSQGSCTVYARQASMTNVHAETCSASFVPICMSYNSDSKTTILKIPKKEKGEPESRNHRNATRRCIKEGGFLADPNIIKEQNVLKENSQAEYWIGVQKWKTHINSVEDPPRFTKEDRCLYVTSGSPDTKTKTTLSCLDDKAAFMCRRKQGVFSPDNLPPQTVCPDVSKSSTLRPESSAGTSPPANKTLSTSSSVASTAVTSSNEDSTTILYNTEDISTTVLDFVNITIVHTSKQVSQIPEVHTTLDAKEINTKPNLADTTDPPLTGINLYLTIAISVLVFILIATCAVVVVLTRRRLCRNNKCPVIKNIDLYDDRPYDHIDIQIPENQRGRKGLTPPLVTHRVEINSADDKLDEKETSFTQFQIPQDVVKQSDKNTQYTYEYVSNKLVNCYCFAKKTDEVRKSSDENLYDLPDTSGTLRGNQPTSSSCSSEQIYSVCTDISTQGTRDDLNDEGICDSPFRGNDSIQPLQNQDACFGENGPYDMFQQNQHKWKQNNDDDYDHVNNFR